VRCNGADAKPATVARRAAQKVSAQAGGWRWFGGRRTHFDKPAESGAVGPWPRLLPPALQKAGPVRAAVAVNCSRPWWSAWWRPKSVRRVWFCWKLTTVTTSCRRRPGASSRPLGRGRKPVLLLPLPLVVVRHERGRLCCGNVGPLKPGPGTVVEMWQTLQRVAAPNGQVLPPTGPPRRLGGHGRCAERGLPSGPVPWAAVAVVRIVGPARHRGRGQVGHRHRTARAVPTAPEIGVGLLI